MAAIIPNTHQVKLSNHPFNMQATSPIPMPHSNDAIKKFTATGHSIRAVINPDNQAYTGHVPAQGRPHLMTYDTAIKALNIFLLLTGFIMLFFIGLLAY